MLESYLNILRIGDSLKRRLSKIVSYVVIPALAFMLSGCLDEFIHPMPKCTDDKVVKKLDTLLDANSLYSSDAKVNEKLIVMVGVNEKTNMKTCKTRVDYSLENDNNNSILNMMNNMPFMSEIAKNREVTYTIAQTVDKKDFIIEIID